MEKEVTLNDLYQLLLKFQSDTNQRFDRIESRLDRIEQRLDTIQEHVANIDERLTQVEKVTKLFNMDVVEKVTA